MTTNQFKISVDGGQSQARFTHRRSPLAGLNFDSSYNPTLQATDGTVNITARTASTDFAKPIYNANGTVGAPSMTFTSDPDTGIYRIGANNLGVSAAGAKVLDISATGLGVTGTTLSGDGTVSLPGFAFTGDTDTGLYRIGANNAAIAVGGTKVADFGASSIKFPADTGGLIPMSFVYDAASVDRAFMVMNRAIKVVAIICRPTVAGTDAGAVTAVVKKAPSGTAIGSGTALTSDSFNLKGTIHTNQTGTLSVTASDLNLAAGDAIGIDFTGVMTAALGAITIWAVPI